MKDKDIGWSFPIDPADQWQGFNNSGIEHFRGNPYVNLAREVMQNSCDSFSKHPVKVSFDLVVIETNKIPDFEELKDAINKCLKASEKESKKAYQFFQKANTTLSKKSIPVLKISDHNTTGMKGPCVNGTSYYAYIKASGQSKKDNEAAGGSYGIGKYAPFAVSEIRTIFISSVFKNNDKFEQYLQGKALLMSHKSDEYTHQGTGYWGLINNCMPITARENMPEWLKRSAGRINSKELGTNIYVIGFDEVSNWENILTASIIENFFAAILIGDVEICINDQIINKNNLRNYYDSENVRSSILEMKGQPDSFDNSKFYYECLLEDQEVITVNHENRHLGNCQIRILIREGLPKRVAVLRNGMFITDQLDGLKRFGDFKEFIAVVECMSKKGNELLRQMEPPRHNDFEPDRLGSPEEQRKGKLAIKELSKWIRETLIRHAKNPVTEVTNLDELADYFGDEQGEKKSKQGEEINPSGKVTIRMQPIRRHSLLAKVEGDAETSGSGVSGGNGSGRGGDAGGSGGEGTSGAGNKGDGKLRVELNDIRQVRSSKGKHKVVFTPTITGKVRLSFYEAGADTDHEIKLIKSSTGKINRNTIEAISVRKDERISIEVEMNKNFYGSIKVIANAI